MHVKAGSNRRRLHAPLLGSTCVSIPCWCIARRWSTLALCLPNAFLLVLTPTRMKSWAGSTLSGPGVARSMVALPNCTGCWCSCVAMWQFICVCLNLELLCGLVNFIVWWNFSLYCVCAWLIWSYNVAWCLNENCAFSRLLHLLCATC
jgi:hypothetical protein